MITRFFSLVGSGLRQLQVHTNYLLLAFLVIVLPLLFIFIAQSFFSVAYDNMVTTEKESINRLHESVALLVQNDQIELVSDYFSQLVENEPRFTQGRIVRQAGRDLVVVAASDSNLIGAVEAEQKVFNFASGEPGDSLILDVELMSGRTWQAAREVFTDQATYYIFTEHAFTPLEATFSSRQQHLYLYLSLVFAFLLALAYWLVQQTNWHQRHDRIKAQVEEQMLFTNTVAHELRAPLTAIRGYNSFLQQSQRLSTEEIKYTNAIQTSADRLLALINDFLEVARIQSNQLKINLVETDIRAVLRAVAAEFDALATEKENIDFTVSLPAKPVIAETDPERLHQVVTNFLSNALKYTEHGSVALELKQTKLKTIIAIKDTGRGIAGEDQQKLFQAFTRVGQTDNSGVTGTGLGMWITKQLVTLLGGAITIESIEGVGTHVKLTFDV
jgi:signal transduction histidine kinase